MTNLSIPFIALFLTLSASSLASDATPSLEELKVKALKYDLLRVSPDFVVVGEKILEALNSGKCGVKESVDFWESDLIGDDAEYGDITTVMLAILETHDVLEHPYYFEKLFKSVKCNGNKWAANFQVQVESKRKNAPGTQSEAAQPSPVTDSYHQLI
ncbi:hypothetical protein VroAM7_50360 (plasmid) [Vibrio rotiferianus]|uniref:Uncharacterized protein n=1 Tax=Vibrio rotiferianus TaxID=190895 RepID=A0A510IF95_9VIBR|nr:hypothetical protein [Vibrio rotiferianus]BBL92383.1 hypothetical protein VroAM7_50360 [Vibrio rotiferianus]